MKGTSKNVIPAKAGIQKFLTSLDSRFCGSDELIIIRGSLKTLHRMATKSFWVEWVLNPKHEVRNNFK
jgi:hypothetical protein